MKLMAFPRWMTFINTKILSENLFGPLKRNIFFASFLLCWDSHSCCLSSRLETREEHSLTVLGFSFQ